MADVIKNINKTLVEIQPDFMTLTHVGATERKINGPTGALKYVPWITLWQFEVAPKASSITQFGQMEFQPKGSGAFDTRKEAEGAAWQFMIDKVEANSMFTLVWNDWAEE
jgi:hypothetical protein